jgi:Fe-S cluster assembly protein SufD
MTQIAEERNAFLSHVTRDGHGAAPGAPAWLERLRRAGLDRFKEVGFPSTKDEAWRFTNVAPIARTAFQPGQPVDLKPDDVAPYTFRDEAACELVFVNGHFAANLSSTRSLPRGVTVGSLSSQLEKQSELLERHVGKYADIRANPFVALNAGFAGDGAFVHVPRGAGSTKPIHLLFVSTAAPGEPTVSHPRVLLVLDDAANATVVESYVGVGRAGGTYFTNSVTEIIVGADAVLDHCKLQEETAESFHVSTTQVRVGRGANFISHGATLGGRLTRNDLACVLDGEHAHATLNGLAILNGEQHCDNNTLLHHEKPNCPSHELYKYVLRDRSSGVFKGKIFVQKDAQQTNAKQTSKSLLLSDDAVMNAMPALEIYADDVKCTHGSTIGPVDEDQLFYLRTRGVGYEAARALMTYAFAADVTRRIKVEPVRRRLEDYMAAQHGLPQDLRITDLSAHDEGVL